MGKWILYKDILILHLCMYLEIQLQSANLYFLLKIL